MQPWTLMSPVMMGQFPAAALIFREGLVQPGKVLASLDLDTNALLRLEGTPLPQDAALDELRLKDVPAGGEVKAGQRLDPLLHYAGQAEVRFGAGPAATRAEDLRPWIDHQKKTVTSTTRELRLDYERGLLVLDAPAAQGCSGDLASGAPIRTRDLEIRSGLQPGHLVVVALDGEPIARSRRMLLQVASEEKPTGFETEPAGEHLRRITRIGRDPWLIREIQGGVRFLRQDAGSLTVTALDFNGYPAKSLGDARDIPLQPSTLYYLISRP
jgi:hypothetical protein